MTDYSSIPEHMREGVMNYLEKGDPPGSFLRAVLCNNLKEAAFHADIINRIHLYEWAVFIYNEVPLVAQGSSEIVDAYLEKKRAQRQDS